MGKQRLDYIDFVKGISIIAVTIGHVIGSYNLGNSWLSFYVYSFELPAFFLMSGWLSQSSEKEYGIKSYILKQAKGVLYPYVMFSISYIIINAMISLRSGLERCIRTVAMDIFYTVSLHGLGALWFMPTFFIATIIAFILWKACGKGDKKIYKLVFFIAVTVLSGCLLSAVTKNLSFWNYKKVPDYSIPRQLAQWYLSLISRSIVGVSLILIGRGMCLLKNILKVNKEKGLIWLCSVLFLVVGFILAIQQTEVVDLHFSYIYNPVLFYVSCICTTVGLLMVGNMITIKWINYFGKNSLIVMGGQLVQGYSCRVVNMFILNPGRNEAMGYVVASIATVIFVLMCSAIAAWFIHKNKYLNLLITPPKRRK